MRSDYAPIIGTLGRQRLNELGYPVTGKEPLDHAVLGLIVAMAEEIDHLRARVDAQERLSRPSIKAHCKP